MKLDPRNDVNKRVLSHSSLSWFKKSPAYFKYMVEHPELKVETPALIFGNLFHSTVRELVDKTKYKKIKDTYFILDPEKDRPDKSMTMAAKENKAWKAAMLVEAGDKKIITGADMTNAKLMADKIMWVAGDLIKAATAYEKKINWRKEGLDMVGFIDGDHPDYMFDYKSALDSNPYKWQRKAFWDFDSHRQAAMYLDGDADGIFTGAKDFYFIVIEKEPPYLVSMHLVGQTKVAQGMTQYNELIQGIKQCRSTKKWPEYHQKIHIWE